MSRKLTEREQQVLRNLNLPLRAESAVRKTWTQSEAPKMATLTQSVIMGLFLPGITFVYAGRAFWPQHMPVGFENIAWVLLTLFMFFASVLLAQRKTLTAKQPLNFWAVCALDRKAWHTYCVRALWLVLVVSMSWSGKTLACMGTVFFWCFSMGVNHECKAMTSKAITVIENDPRPMIIEIN
jgi:hypothetical protein